MQSRFYPGINLRGMSHREGAKLSPRPQGGVVVLGRGQRVPLPPARESGGAL